MEELTKLLAPLGGGADGMGAFQNFHQHIASNPWARQTPSPNGHVDHLISPVRRSPDGSDMNRVISPPRRIPLPANLTPPYEVSPSDEELRVARVVERMKMAVAVWKDAELSVYGASANGFGEAGADIDMTVQVRFSELQSDQGSPNPKQQKELLLKGLHVLKVQCKFLGFTVREIVADAAYPVMRLSLGDSECAVTINNLAPMYNTKLLHAYTQVDSRVVSLVQSIKSWAKQNGVHDEKQGFLSTYSLTLMGIFYCQVAGAFPSLQALGEDESMFLGSDWTSAGVSSVGFARPDHPAVAAFVAGRQAWPAEVDLEGFFRFYGKEFAWGEEVVSVRVGRRRSVSSFPGLIRSTSEPEMIHIEDPIETARDLSSVFLPGHCAMLRAAFSVEARQGMSRVDSHAFHGTNGKPVDAEPDVSLENLVSQMQGNWHLPGLPPQSALPVIPPEMLLDPAFAEHLGPLFAQAMGVPDMAMRDMPSPSSAAARLWAPPDMGASGWPSSWAPETPDPRRSFEKKAPKDQKKYGLDDISRGPKDMLTPPRLTPPRNPIQSNAEKASEGERLRGAVKSLYLDQVKPTIGIIRRRVQELYNVDMTCKTIEQSLGSAHDVILDGKTSNHTALLIEMEAVFVDPLDLNDPYPEEVWNEINEVAAAAAASQVYWRGGRYGCAQQLKALPILSKYTLGQVQHIVQLAIQKKLLGYKGGTLVAYELSRHGHKGEKRDTGLA